MNKTKGQKDIQKNTHTNVQLKIEQHEPHNKLYIENFMTLNTANIFFQYDSGGILVSVLVSSALNRGFEPGSGQTKDCNMYLLLLR
jgi:hypothetical protein